MPNAHRTVPIFCGVCRMYPALDSNSAQEEFEPATIIEAYNELTQEGFAVWMRLLVATDAQLKQGRRAISQLVGYSEGRCNVILRELKHKGYIALMRADRPGLPTSIKILRKALISGPARVIRLGRDAPIQKPDKNFAPEPELRSVLAVFSQFSENTLSEKSLCDSRNPAGDNPFLSAHHSKKHHNLFSQSSKNTPKAGTGTAHEIAGEKKRKKMKFLGLSGEYVTKNAPDPETTSQAENRVGLYKPSYKEIKKKEQERRKKVENRHKASSKSRVAKGKGKLDRRGKPLVRFNLTDEERAAVIADLDRPPQSPRRRNLIAKLETEACRIYTRYRREFNQTYSVTDGERKYMRAFGELCIRKGVTPKQVISYWRVHIKTFANQGLEIVPPHFISSPANIDTAAIAVMVATKGGKRKWKGPESFKSERTPITDSFSDVSKLHPKLRKGLESAGFDISDYTDRHLMSVQSPAITIAKGRGNDVYMSKRLRAMAEWAAEHIYKPEMEDGDED